MQKYAVMVDSACAPTQELMGRENLFSMGMKINLDGTVYTDGEDLALEDYYGSIERIRDFSTTPPQVWDIKKSYEEVKRKGYSSLISIHVSSKMSKLIETCENAGGMVGGLEVKIIDTANISLGAYFVAEKVIELIDAGWDYEEIQRVMPAIRESTFFQFSLPTLKYLIKNKRVGKIQGMFGNMLKVKPILGLDDEGYLTTLSKERGGQRVIEKISENAIAFVKSHPHNVKFYLAWGFDKNKKMVDQVFNKFMPHFRLLGIKDYKVYKNRIMPTIGCNSGPDAYGFGIYGEKQPIGKY